jgi:hypothetical protein
MDALFLHPRVGPVWIAQKAHWDTLSQTCVFVSGGIYGSCSAFWFVQGVKRRCTIFHAWVGPVQIPQKITLGDVTVNLSFSIRWGLCIT